MYILFIHLSINSFIFQHEISGFNEIIFESPLWGLLGTQKEEVIFFFPAALIILWNLSSRPGIELRSLAVKA